MGASFPGSSVFIPPERIKKKVAIPHMIKIVKNPATTYRMVFDFFFLGPVCFDTPAFAGPLTTGDGAGFSSGLRIVSLRFSVAGMAGELDMEDFCGPGSSE